MRRIALLPIAAAVLFAGTAFALIQEKPKVAVASAPGCGCCHGWADHLRDSGFEVTVAETEALAELKAQVGIPPDLQSCHTARVAGYLLEGHVPSQAIGKLLRKKPRDIIGLAVPGMPEGSPGMEGPSPQPYTVYAMKADGTRVAFMEVTP